MQDAPLTLPHLFGRAERLFFDKELVTATATGLERTDYGTWAERTRRLGGVLDDLGISEHGRVATFAWNTARHLELYFAAPCSEPGAPHAQHPAVPRAARLHRQPRRGRGHLRRPVADRAAVAARRPADDRAPHRRDGRRQGRGAEPRRRSPRCTTTRTCSPRRRRSSSTSTTRTRPRRCATRAARPATPRASCTPPLDVPAHPRRRWWPAGSPSRRATVILPVVPMFHANAWGLAHAAVASGATLVMPGPGPVAPGPGQAHRGASGSPSPRACPPSGWACCPSSRAGTPRRCEPSCAAAPPCPARCRRATGPRRACRSCRRGA